MRAVRALAALLCAVALPGAALGADLRLGVAGETEYDSNVFRSPNDEKSDAIFRVIPRIGIAEDEGKFTYDGYYSFPYEIGAIYGQISNISHLANMDMGYQATDRTHVGFSDGFTHSESPYYSSRSGPEPTDTVTVNNGRQTVTYNNATLRFDHHFTPRLDGGLSFGNEVFETDQRDRQNNLVFSSTGSLDYAISERHRLGGGMTGTVQLFDSASGGAIPQSRTLFLNFFGAWTWYLDERTTFRVSGGPTFVDTHQDAPTGQELTGQPSVTYTVKGGGDPSTSDILADSFTSCGVFDGQPVKLVTGTCGQQVLLPANTGNPLIEADRMAILGAAPVDYAGATPPSSLDEISWTFFGGASLERRWSPNVTSSLSYSRRNSTASGLAGSAYLDAVSLSTEWRISDLWDAGILGDWTRRNSVASQEITALAVSQGGPFLSVPGFFMTQTAGLLVPVRFQDAVDTDRWGISARISRQLTRRMVATLRYSFNRETSSRGSVGSSSNFDDHLVTLGVQWDMEPWRLW